MTKSQMFVVDNHPAIPPGYLLKQWEDKWFDEEEHQDVLLIQAYQAGADEELEACCDVLKDWGSCLSSDLRAARRPKPPSLKEQALELARPAEAEGAYVTFGPDELATIRRALEQIDD